MARSPTLLFTISPYQLQSEVRFCQGPPALATFSTSLVKWSHNKLHRIPEAILRGFSREKQTESSNVLFRFLITLFASSAWKPTIVHTSNL